MKFWKRNYQSIKNLNGQKYNNDFVDLSKKYKNFFKINIYQMMKI